MTMDSEELRRRLQSRPPSAALSDDLASDAGRHRPWPVQRPRMAAAVLIGVVGYATGPRVILTLRTEHLKTHAGQVSFPGGRVEPIDAGPEATALREAQEEIGLRPERVEVLGRLSPYDTITGFRVDPVVGWIEPPVVYSPDPVEVAEVFEVPLKIVLDLRNYRRASHLRDDVRRTFYVLTYDGHRIWGATAGMLVSLAQAVGE